MCAETPSGATERKDRLAATEYRLFDEDSPSEERIPRRFRVEFREIKREAQPKVVLTRDSRRVGDELTDNSYTDDGYRFHDVFHFGLAALLGWSPMTRTLFDCKRRSNPTIDEVEDGGRARVIEEAICALAYDYARKRHYLAGEHSVEPELLDIVRSLAWDREVKTRSAAEWEHAILQIYDVWRKMWASGGGVLEADLSERQIIYLSR